MTADCAMLKLDVADEGSYMLSLYEPSYASALTNAEGEVKSGMGGGRESECDV